MSTLIHPGPKRARPQVGKQASIYSSGKKVPGHGARFPVFTPPKPFITPTTFSFELRESDTLNETGIAVLNHHDVFLGWIKKDDIHELPVGKISELDGIILTVELFIWAAGGGQCVRRTLFINHGIDCFPCDQSHA